jgi:hypothetical protein
MAMRILFYLPVITPWWFENIMVHLIRAAAQEAEVHVAITPLWRMTGIGERQLMSCADMPDIRWHVLAGEGHEALRTRPRDPDALVDFVRGIDPDYTFCRSADMETPRRFPGQVRFVMEASVPPTPMSTWITLQADGIYDHGVLPPLDADQRTYLDGRMAPDWEQLQALYLMNEAARTAYLAKAGLPDDRKIVTLPIDYEGEENFFYELHRVTPPNAEFIAEAARHAGDDIVLALTKHPIEHANRYPKIARVAAQMPDRVRMVEEPGPARHSTMSLMQHGDGLIVRDSKAFAFSPFFGKPMLRMSGFASGEWMNAYDELPAFFDAVRSGTPRTAASEDALTWFAFHHANNVFDADDVELTLEDLIDRVDRPVNPTRWDAGLERFHTQWF